jgi:hypothetical protein
VRRLLDWLPIVLGIAFLLSLAYLQRERTLKGQNDFVAFYTGARLAGTPDLYSRTANLAAINRILGFPLEGVTYIRPPFYAALLKPLAALPYRAAYAIFMLATLSSILWFVIRFSRECPSLPFFAAFSLPLLTAFCNGQDTPFLLMLLGVSILLLRRNRDFPAGLVFSLCAIKFHLFLFLLALLFLKKRWRVLGGGACGTFVLTALGALVAGADSMRGWVNVMRDPWITPNPEILPNLHGLVLALHGDVRLELLLTGVVCLTFLWMVYQTDNFEFLFAVSLVCGLLTSFHSGAADDVLLFPVFLLVLVSSGHALLRSLSALLLTPVPYLMIFAGPPYSAVLPVMLAGVLAVAGVTLPKRNRSPGQFPARDQPNPYSGPLALKERDALSDDPAGC